MNQVPMTLKDLVQAQLRQRLDDGGNNSALTVEANTCPAEDFWTLVAEAGTQA